MRRLSILAPLIIAIFLYSAWFNPQPVELTVYPGETRQIPVAAALAAAFFAGAFFFFLFYLGDWIKTSLTIAGLNRKLREHKKTRTSFQTALSAIAANDAKNAEKILASLVATEKKALEAATPEDKLEPAERTETTAAGFEAAMLYGTMKRKQGNPADAAELHEFAASLKPGNFYAQYELAEDCFSMGDHAGAVRALEKIASADRKNPKPLRRIRDVYESLNRFAEAIPVQEKIVSLTPRRAAEFHHESTLLAAMYYRHALQLYAANRPDPAADLLRRSIGRDSGFLPGYISLFFLHAATGEPARGLDVLRTAVKVTRSETLAQEIPALLRSAGLAHAVPEFTQWCMSKLPWSVRAGLIAVEESILAGDTDTATRLMACINQEKASTDPYYPLIKIKLDSAERTQTATGAKFGDIAPTSFGRMRFDSVALDSNPNLAAPAADPLRRAALVYQCRNCGTNTDHFLGRCQNCGEWNSVRLKNEIAPPPKTGLLAWFSRS